MISGHSHSFDVGIAKLLGINAVIVFAIISENKSITTQDIVDVLNYIPKHHVELGIHFLEKEEYIRQVNGNWEVI